MNKIRKVSSPNTLYFGLWNVENINNEYVKIMFNEYSLTRARSQHSSLPLDTFVPESRYDGLHPSQ